MKVSSLCNTATTPNGHTSDATRPGVRGRMTHRREPVHTGYPESACKSRDVNGSTCNGQSQVKISRPETHVRAAVRNDVGGGALIVRDISQKASAISGNDIYPEVALWFSALTHGIALTGWTCLAGAGALRVGSGRDAASWSRWLCATEVFRTTGKHWIKSAPYPVSTSKLSQFRVLPQHIHAPCGR
jgi:hypothetical protein